MHALTISVAQGPSVRAGVLGVYLWAVLKGRPDPVVRRACHLPYDQGKIKQPIKPPGKDLAAQLHPCLWTCSASRLLLCTTGRARSGVEVGEMEVA